MSEHESPELRQMVANLDHINSTMSKILSSFTAEPTLEVEQLCDDCERPVEPDWTNCHWCDAQDYDMIMSQE